MNQTIIMGDDPRSQAILQQQASNSLPFSFERLKGVNWAGVIDKNETIQAIVAGSSLPWDTQVLNIESGVIKLLWAQGDYRQQRSCLARLLEHFLKKNLGPDTVFVKARISCMDLAALHALEDCGFKVIETYIDFRFHLEQLDAKPDADIRIRLAEKSEIDAVKQIALTAFRYNRYMMDPQLPDREARESRMIWVENSFRGRAEAVYVACIDEQITGFLILRKTSNENGHKIGLIDLIAIDPAFTKQGLGMALVQQSLHHYFESAQFIDVGTQANNVAAISLYLKMGFKYHRPSYTLHLHA
jgi:ribosomal protein S18 acetylase RimI-like enzyme